MSSRFAFHVESQDNRRRDLPERVFIGRKETETTKHVLLKFLGFVLFHRERLRIEARDPDVSHFRLHARLQLGDEFAGRQRAIPIQLAQVGDVEADRFGHGASSTSTMRSWPAATDVPSAQNIL